MKMLMEQTQIQTYRQELEPPEKAMIENAARFWEKGQHFTMQFPLSVMIEAMGAKQGESAKTALAKGDQFQAEFVKLTKAEINELDEGEHYGSQVGDYIFVSDQVPDEYLPMVVANLGFLREIGDNNPLQQCLGDSGIDVDTTNHWTANLLDIMLAEQAFADDPEQLKKFLAWRKGIERTEFFRNPLIGEILKKREGLKNYRRTTHPMQRSFHSRQSWEFSGMLYALGKRAVDENIRLLGIAKPDIILRTVCDKYGEDFDPEYMLELMDYTDNHMETRREHCRQKNFIDLSKAGDKKKQLVSQAELLTADAVGEAAIMDSTQDPFVYDLRPFHGRSLEALKNKIVFFARQGLLASGLTRKLLAFTLKAAKATHDQGPDAIELELGSGHEGRNLALQKIKLRCKIDEIQQALDRFIQLRIKLTDMDAVKYVPGKLEESYWQLIKLQGEQQAKLDEIGEAEKTLEEFTALIKEQRSLLSSMEGINDEAAVDAEKRGKEKVA